MSDLKYFEDLESRDVSSEMELRAMFRQTGMPPSSEALERMAIRAARVPEQAGKGVAVVMRRGGSAAAFWIAAAACLFVALVWPGRALFFPGEGSRADLGVADILEQPGSEPAVAGADLRDQLTSTGVSGYVALSELENDPLNQGAAVQEVSLDLLHGPASDDEARMWIAVYDSVLSESE